MRIVTTNHFKNEKFSKSSVFFKVVLHMPAHTKATHQHNLAASKAKNKRTTTAAALGCWAEQQAAQLLVKQGWQVLQRNYHSRYGEIDLIANRDTELLMVEVKARSMGSYAMATEVVSRSKQQRLLKTAMVFLQEYPELNDYAIRFDVICFDFTEKIAKTVQQDFAQLRYDRQWIENAFTLNFESFTLASDFW